MKVILKKQNYYSQDLLVSKKLTPGKLYEAELLSFTDVITGKTCSPIYIITCDDKKNRRIEVDYFTPQHELRDQILTELGISD